MKQRKRVSPEMRVLESFIMVLAGASVLFYVVVAPTNETVGMLSFLLSLGLIGLGGIDLLFGIQKLPTFDELKARAEDFKNDHRGIISIWIVCFISLIVYSILWFTLGWATFSIIDTVTASFSFPAQANVTITAMRTVLTWHPILFFFGMLLWAYNLSQKTEEVTQPIGYL